MARLRGSDHSAVSVAADGVPPAFLVGLRYQHHARHSGYDRVAEHLGHWIKTPIRARYFPGRLGTAVNRLLAAAVGQPKYSVGVLLAEVAAAVHMLRRDNALYHVMYGERDLLLLRFLARRSGNRLVATFHGPLGTPPPPRAWLPDTLDAAILVAEYQRSHFESLLPPERIFVVRHGVDSEFFHPGDAAAADRTCITVGSHQRDFTTFARAVEHVWRRDPGVRFVFAGIESPGVLGPLASDPRVSVLGRISDAELRAAYRAAGVALFAFEDATASNALLEAMACGLPIVATDVGGIGEYVNGDAACLCPPRDAERMADEVLGLLDDRDRVRRMGRASRALAVEHDYRAMAAEVREVYARVLG
jgi:glycosyltransferase involved in cell wall biosynthesis